LDPAAIGKVMVVERRMEIAEMLANQLGARIAGELFRSRIDFDEQACLAIDNTHGGPRVGPAHLKQSAGSTKDRMSAHCVHL